MNNNSGWNNRNHQNNKFQNGKPQNRNERYDDSEKYANYFNEIILKITSLKEEYDKYINECKDYAYYLKRDGLTTSQVRKIYSDIMNAETAIDLKRLRPRLAYIIGKNEKNRAIKSLINILDKGIEKLNIKDVDEEIKSLKEFMETIVAYRRYVGNDK